jgi:hypothetical protein
MATEQTDEGAKLLRDIEAHGLRLQKNPPKTLDGLAGEMSGTVLEFVKDVLAQQIALRDWVYETVSVLDGRLAGVEGDETRIMPEDGEKLLALIDGSKLLITRSLEAALPADVKKGLEELSALADECKDIVEDSIVEEEEEEEETEGAEGGAADGATPAS